MTLNTVEGRGGLTSHIRSPIWEMSGKNHLLGQAGREEGNERGQGFWRLGIFHFFTWSEKRKKKRKRKKRKKLTCHVMINFFFFKLKSEVACHVRYFLYQKRPLATSAFSIQHLTARTILTQGWKVNDQFDTVERLRTNLT